MKGAGEGHLAGSLEHKGGNSVGTMGTRRVTYPIVQASTHLMTL